jgi:hypothetical protein
VRGWLLAVACSLAIAGVLGFGLSQYAARSSESTATPTPTPHTCVHSHHKRTCLRRQRELQRKSHR